MTLRWSGWRRRPRLARVDTPGESGQAEAGAIAAIMTDAGALCGLLKRDGMRRELDPGSLALQSAVRQALDPLAIFNPGKG
jgi:glycolate oxidase